MRRSSFRTQIVSLGILIVASVIGNVSMSAARTSGQATDRVDVPVNATASSIAFAAVEASDTTSTDETRVVPAIYSWDPDITFVFYRHVTKWM